MKMDKTSFKLSMLFLKEIAGEITAQVIEEFYPTENEYEINTKIKEDNDDIVATVRERMREELILNKEELGIEEEDAEKLVNEIDVNISFVPISDTFLPLGQKKDKKWGLN